MDKLFISADSLLRDSLELARIIVASGFRPTFLVAMWRGGTPIGIAVQEVLEYHSIHTDHIAIRTSSYYGIDRQEKTVRVHAIDYLIDESEEDGSATDAAKGRAKAVGLLMAINRQIYFECPEVPTIGDSWHSFLRSHGG